MRTKPLVLKCHLHLCMAKGPATFAKSKSTIAKGCHKVNFDKSAETPALGMFLKKLTDLHVELLAMCLPLLEVFHAARYFLSIIALQNVVLRVMASLQSFRGNPLSQSIKIKC